MNLMNKVAIVTGASRGIGAHIAKTLSRAGAQVVVNYAENRLAAEQVAGEIRATGEKAIIVKADVGNADEVRAMFDEAIAQFGKVDILVNNAAINRYNRIQETTEEDFDSSFKVNVKGVFLTLREAATRMSNGGRIVNLSSSVTRHMMPTYGIYAATKGAIEQLTRVFAQEIGERGITVNSISPGPTNTERFAKGKTEEALKRMASMAALGRIGEPADIARVVLFLVSDEAAWVSAQNLGANGGFA